MPTAPAPATEHPCTDGNARVPQTDQRLALLCALALTAAQTRTWLLNYSVFPVVSATFPAARELQTLVAPLVGLAVIFLVMRCPTAIRPKAALGLACASDLAGAAILLAAPGSALGASAGCMLHAFSGVWYFYLAGIVLARIEGAHAGEGR